ncbi:YhgE/Pip family protein [Agrilactobacillus yilanensis]|uniref:YhgE/Pip family protein n=1 Tax=Agrilactobacillus yilanensis TaxID=2485997 RepID=A0ABW4J8W0_9LACO
MIKAEWQFLAKNKFILIVLCVIVLIPSIYAVIFLKSLWNPYGELQDLPVAIVNQDHSTTYQGKKLALGHDLTDNLKHSSALGFHEVTSTAQAKKGLRQGKYYMVLTIPKDFSKNATTLLNKRPKKMVIHYDTSSGHSFFAGKATTSAAKNIQSKVSQQVTKTYAKTLFTAIQKLDQGLASAQSGNQKLATGSQTATSANQEITKNLDTLASSTLTLANGTESLNHGLDQYIYGVTALQAGNQKLQTGLAQLAAQSPTLVTGISQLDQGARNLTTGTNTYVAGTQKLAQNMTTVNQGTATLNTGLQQLNQKTGNLTTSTQALQTGATNLTASLQQLGTSGSTIANQLTQLSQQLAADTPASTKLNTQITALDQTLAQLNTSNDAMVQVKNDLDQLQTTLNQNSATDLADQVARVADAQNLTATQKQAILAVIKTNDTQTAAIQQATTTLATSITALANDLPAKTTTIAPVTQADSSSSLAQLATATEQLAGGIQQAATGSETLTTGLTTLNNGLPALTGGIQQLSQGSAQLATGTAQLNTGSQTLANSGTQLTSGTQSLSQGLDQLTAQTPTLVQGIQQLNTGAQTLGTGYQQLSANNATLMAGGEKLANGQTQLTTGAEKLANGSGQLTDALTQISTGNQTLATKLGTAAKQAKMNPSQLTYAQVAKPVTTTHDETDKVPNNGTGMAPYMMCVSLFVGALALNMMFDLYTPRRFPDGPLGWWASKASIWGGFVLFASILMGTLVMVVDGLSPVQTAATFGMLLLIGLTFMSIVVWLNLVFGKAGAFFSMVLLVLQLGSSAGTYPIELSSHFFQVLHPWLPMTYGVNGLRQALMIGDSIWPDVRVLFIFFTIFTLLTLLFFTRRRSKMKSINFDDPLAVQATQNKIAARLAKRKEA